jgi:hypothetical protein
MLSKKNLDIHVPSSGKEGERVESQLRVRSDWQDWAGPLCLLWYFLPVCLASDLSSPYVLFSGVPVPHVRSLLPFCFCQVKESHACSS